MRNGTIRRITAVTTDSFEGATATPHWIRFGASGGAIVAALMKLLPVDDVS